MQAISLLTRAISRMELVLRWCYFEVSRSSDYSPTDSSTRCRHPLPEHITHTVPHSTSSSLSRPPTPEKQIAFPHFLLTLSHTNTHTHIHTQVHTRYHSWPPFKIKTHAVLLIIREQEHTLCFSITCTPTARKQPASAAVVDMQMLLREDQLQEINTCKSASLDNPYMLCFDFSQFFRVNVCVCVCVLWDLQSTFYMKRLDRSERVADDN